MTPSFLPLLVTAGLLFAAPGLPQTASVDKPRGSTSGPKLSPWPLGWKPVRWVQIGPLYDRAAAREMAADLRRLGYEAHHRDDLFVAVEPKDETQQALELASELSGQGFHRAPMSMIVPWTETAAEDPAQVADDQRPDRVRTTSSLEVATPPVGGPPPGEASPATQMSFGIQPPLPLAEELASGDRDLARSRPRTRVERLSLEASAPRRPETDSFSDVYIEVASEFQPQDALYLRFGVRADGTLQTGSAGSAGSTDVRRATVDFDETYLQLRLGGLRLTAGWQKPIWGRLSLAPPSDVLSTYDLSRYVLFDPASERRVAPAARLEAYLGAWKADALFLPGFRAAELAPISSLWSPIDQHRGAILGFPSSNPIFRELVRNGTFGVEPTPGGGGGFRLSRTGALDFGITAVEARLSLPYYRLNDDLRRALVAGTPPALAFQQGVPTFLEIHPRNRLYGLDLGFEKLGAVWRLEAARLSDLPVTRADGTVASVPGIRWGAEAELVPFGPALRVNVAASGYHLAAGEPFLDPRRAVRLSGELDGRWAHDRYRARLRFIYGVTPNELYLNPELALLEFEPYELFVGYHFFDGEEITASGFFSDRDLIIVGVRRGF